MEFYFIPQKERRKLQKVSIPNGMEFYYILAPLARTLSGFNSQWDGILQGIDPKALDTIMAFQFPTGWNSTGEYAFDENGKLVFQFPTGWNSTVPAFDYARARQSFNSQRDGILLYQAA